MDQLQSQQRDAAAPGQVKVVCRVRPLNQTEMNNQGSQVCVELLDQKTIKIKQSKAETEKGEKSIFSFDHVFPMQSTQQEIYEIAAQPLVESVLEGFNGTILAYGQTSSGKTHTMQGPDIEDPELKGIIPRMVTTVFDNISKSPDHVEFRIKVSMVEIYLEKVRDLLDFSKNNLQIREDKTRGVYIQDVTETYVTEEKEIHEQMKMGNRNRMIAITQMNEASSRSHLIFTMNISQKNLLDLSAKTGKLFLVDLAGSEKISKTGAEGKTLDEAKRINQSLSCLGNVINSLTDGKSSHIPYRDSKLTRILQESLGGNARTTLIITCSPSVYNEAETISTLRFGIRAKNIKNKPKINRELTVEELQLLLEKAGKEINELKQRVKQLENFIINKGLQLPENMNDLQKQLSNDSLIKSQLSQNSQNQQQQLSDSAQVNQSQNLVAAAASIQLQSQNSIDQDQINNNQTIIQSQDDLQMAPEIDQQGTLATLRKTDIADYIEQIKSIELELNNQMQSLKAETEKYNQLKMEYCELQNEFQKCSENEQSMRLFIQQQDEKHREDISNLESECLKLQESLVKKEEQFIQLEERFREKEDQLDKEEAASLKLQKDLEQLTQQRDSMNEQLQLKIQEIENQDLQSKVEGLKSQMNNNFDPEKYLQEIKQENKALSAECQQHMSLINSLLEKIKENGQEELQKMIQQHFDAKNQVQVQNSNDQQDQNKQKTAIADLLLEQLQQSKYIQQMEFEINKLKAKNEEQLKEIKMLQSIKDKFLKQQDSKSQQSQAIFNEKFEKERQKYEEEKQLQLNDIQQLLEQKQKLTIQLDQQADIIRSMESKFGQGAKGDLKKNITRLERSLQELSFKYHELVNQLNYRNVDCIQNEKKLARKNETILQKDAEIKQIKNELQTLKINSESKIKQLTDEILQIKQNSFKEGNLRLSIQNTQNKYFSELQDYNSLQQNSPLYTTKANQKIVRAVRGGAKSQQFDQNSITALKLNQYKSNETNI